MDSQQDHNILHSSKTFRPALGHMEPLLQWVMGVSLPGIKQQGVKLTAHPHLVPQRRINGVISLSLICHHGMYRDSFIVAYHGR